MMVMMMVIIMMMVVVTMMTMMMMMMVLVRDAGMGVIQASLMGRYQGNDSVAACMMLSS